MQPGLFFRAVFGTARGFVCIALRKKTGWSETFYRYPDQLKDMHEYVERQKYAGDVYFCPQLLSEPKRTKTNVSSTTCAWADLDTCHPRELLVRPTIALESSPNRYQAFWAFESPQEPVEGESLARRIAYHHADEGADRSGWDLTQVLRIPGTRNFKYGEGASAPEVKVIEQNDTKYRLDDFDEYPQADGYEHLDIPFPQIIIEDGVKILERYSFKISGSAHTLFAQPIEGDTDRSTNLFRLEMLCLEAGMTREEAFQVARDAQCNKWPERHDLLWRDICRAYSQHEVNVKLGTSPVKREAPLVSDGERKDVESSPGYIERYIDWARHLGDAAIQYHQAGALISLSSMLASSVVLPTSFGTIYTNVWVCILADTTITRKSTAMNLSVDLMQDIDDSLIMSTDGSIEGLSSALSARSGQVSVLVRDEVTGLFEQMAKKEYMGGMSEFFTQLYDGRTQSRHLRKEQIKIRDPRLLMFVGGIKSRMQQLITHEQVSSGFLPRFIFISAKSDPTKIKPLGPPTTKNLGQRDEIRSELMEIRQHYKSQVPITMGGKVIGVEDKITNAELTPDAWKRFNQIDQTMTQQGLDSGDMAEVLTPMYARLGFSMLKTAVLIAASRQREERVRVDLEDVVRAAYYTESWRLYAQDIIANVGKGPLEHKIELIARAVQRNDHVARSKLMQTYHLNANEMNLIARTLEERGLVIITQHGRQQIFQSTLTETEVVLAK